MTDDYPRVADADHAEILTALAASPAEPAIQQWIITVPLEGGELLVTLYPAWAGAPAVIEVAPRVGPSSWGPPLPVREVQP